MKVEHYSKTPAQAVPDVPGVTVRWVIAEQDSAPNFYMRVFDVKPGNSSLFHQHEWEHEVFVLAGSGVVRNDHGEVPIGEGTVVFVPGMENHQFANTGSDVLRFICLIPSTTT